MNWIKKLFGIKSDIEKKQDRLKALQDKGFQAQRNGNLSLAGKYYSEAEILETEIVKMIEDKNESR